MRVIIMAGGTGGHVFPALQLADVLQQQGHNVHWIGTANRLEAKLVPAANITFTAISVAGLRKAGWRRCLWAPVQLFRALWQSVRLFYRIKPHWVIGFGGYITGPGGVAAWIMRIPLLLHEQNAVMGLTNRWLAPVAQHVFLGLPLAKPAPHSVKAHAITLSGCPLRPAILAVGQHRLNALSIKPPKTHSMTIRAPRLLIIGGSLGAHILNHTVPEAIALLQKQLPACSIAIQHQSGANNLHSTKKKYTQRGIIAQVHAFIEDMASAYAWADIVICRCGGMSIAEIAASGVASILVPLPWAADQHQWYNAQHLVAAGAARCIEQSQCNAMTLSQTLTELFADPNQYVAMQEAALTAAQTQATETINAYLLE